MNVKETIHSHIVSELLPSHYAELGTDESLLGILDSLDLESLILFLEEQFSINIDYLDITLEHFQSIESIAAYVERKLTA